eukprot:1331235-Amphidinium_carterae.1
MQHPCRKRKSSHQAEELARASRVESPQAPFTAIRHIVANGTYFWEPWNSVLGCLLISEKMLRTNIVQGTTKVLEQKKRRS